MSGERRVVMAEIGAPHGVRGAVRIVVFAEEPMALKRYNPFETADGRTLKLRSVKAMGKGLVAEFDGVADRDAAAALRGARLMVPRSRLPRPEEDEFYHVDLVGLEARLADGGTLGRVHGVADFGAGDVLEIRGGTTVMVPFTRDVVPEVDVAGGYLVVRPPPGLLDEPDGDEAAQPDPGETAGDDPDPGQAGRP
jgi:16S rRNA processing protein RimM